MSSSNIIVLKSSDGETFEVEEAVALESQKIKVMIEDSPLPDVTTKILSIGDVTSKILSMVIEYCKKHVDTPAEDLKSFDSDLVKVDLGTLFDLILAANSLDIKSLLDVAYQAVADMIKGKTAEEIRMTFNIENDFTPEEERKVYMETEGPPFELINLGQKQVSLDHPQTSKRMRMSEYIVSPSHQKEIMIRLPVASVLECRRVSKAWKSLIDRPQFITAHSHHRRTHSRLLLVSNLMPEKDDDDVYDHDVRYSSIRDDDTFPHQQSKLTPPLPIGELYGMVVVGSSHGLMCLRGIAPKRGKLVAVLWNPSIRKTVVVPYHHTLGGLPGLGFGVCPVTGETKLLTVDFDDGVAKVFTLSKQEWRYITMPPLVRTWGATTTDKFIYSCTSFDKKLVSFDLTRETYKVTDLPKDLTSFKYTCKIGDSFAMVVPDRPGKNAFESSSVWILKDDGAQTSFTKLFNITCQSYSDRILASRTNGMLIMLHGNPIPADDCCSSLDYEPPRIVDYEPKSGDYKPLVIAEAVDYDINVEPYEQTLLLLDCHATITMIGG